MVSEAGFNPSKNFEALAPSAYEAAEAKRTHLFQGGDFGGGGIWYLFGVQEIKKLADSFDSFVEFAL